MERVEIKPEIEKAAEKAAETPVNEKTSIQSLVDDAKQVNALKLLRTTLDWTKERSNWLHDQVWRGIAKETYYGRDLKFEPEHEQ